MRSVYIKLVTLYLLICLLIGSVLLSDCQAQTVTIYTFPPPHPIRWKHPHSLVISTIRNYYTKSHLQPARALGHVVIRLTKDSSTLLTGIVPDSITDLKRSILKDKIGMGVLFKMVAGHLEETSIVEQELNHRIKHDQAAFITFKISDTAYQYLRLYLDSFKIKGYDKFYNGLNHPREGTGCGCSAFGISFLELINALNPAFKEKWAIHVRIPEKLIGNENSGKKVSIWKLFFSFRWAKKSSAHSLLTLYEPYLIYKWINSMWDLEQKKPTEKYKRLSAGNVKGLEIDCISCLPSLPMFLK